MDLKRYEDDLNSLVNIAEKQGNRINLAMILFTCKCDTDDIQDFLDFFNENGIDVISEDVEVDDSNEVIDHSVKPFDPSKIDIKMDKITIDSIIKRINNEELEMDSSFQRKKGLWNLKQKSQLIESIFLKIPLPAFYFDASDDDRWQIIDGLQRISTIQEYVINKSFVLKGLEFLSDFEGLRFDQLPRAMQRRIEETNLNAYLVNPATPKNVKFNIFKRINTGGLILESQEIRNALYQGRATEFLIEMAGTMEFKEATDFSIRSDRMLDREFCLRYVSVTRKNLDDLIYGVDEFLNMGMEYLAEASDEELSSIKVEFKKTMIYCRDIFGKYAFRKINEARRRGPVNKYLFEAWSILMRNRSADEIERLKEKREDLLSRFSVLCSDNSFQSLLRSADRNSTRNRLKRISDLIDDMLSEGEKV